jgi:hypothetical protein
MAPAIDSSEVAKTTRVLGKASSVLPKKTREVATHEPPDEEPPISRHRRLPRSRGGSSRCCRLTPPAVPLDAGIAVCVRSRCALSVRKTRPAYAARPARADLRNMDAFETSFENTGDSYAYVGRLAVASLGVPGHLDLNRRDQVLMGMAALTHANLRGVGPDDREALLLGFDHAAAWAAENEAMMGFPHWTSAPGVLHDVFNRRGDLVNDQE